MGDREFGPAAARRGWLTPTAILAPPWVAVSVWIGFLFAAEWSSVPVSLQAFQVIAVGHFLFAVAGSAAGGVGVRGPLGTRVAVGIASAVYGGSTVFWLLELITWLMNL